MLEVRIVGKQGEREVVIHAHAPAGEERELDKTAIRNLLMYADYTPHPDLFRSMQIDSLGGSAWIRGLDEETASRLAAWVIANGERSRTVPKQAVEDALAISFLGDLTNILADAALGLLDDAPPSPGCDCPACARKRALGQRDRTPEEDAMWHELVGLVNDLQAPPLPFDLEKLLGR